MNIAIGCDPNATEFTAQIIDYVKALGHTCTDFGSDDPLYPNTAIKVAESTVKGEFSS